MSTLSRADVDVNANGIARAAGGARVDLVVEELHEAEALDHRSMVAPIGARARVRILDCLAVRQQSRS